MENTAIEWADHTFNPWMGCTKVSPGCANCYAESLMDRRYGRVQWGKGKPRVRTKSATWRKPVRWNREAEGAAVRPRVFCASLADWLDEEVPVDWLVDLLVLIRETPNLDWLLLTKRPQNWRARLQEARCTRREDVRWLKGWLDGVPPANVWLGTSAEDQARWDERLPSLLGIPARLRFVSAEPLLGPIRMGAASPDWLIVGGESGPGARPMEAEWVEGLYEQYTRRAWRMSFHFKQWGGVNKKAAGRTFKGRVWDDVPLVGRKQEVRG